MQQQKFGIFLLFSVFVYELIFLMEESCSVAYVDDEVAGIRAMPGDRDGGEEEEGTLVSLDAILPDELLEKVLSLLPIASIVESGFVCKRWYKVVHSPRLSWATMPLQKPWYFMFLCDDDDLSGHVYDPCLRQWYDFGFSCFEKSNWHVSSSCGLVCAMDRDDGSRLLVGNPITRVWKRLPQLPGGRSPDYNALAVSFDRRTRGYTVTVAKCTQAPGDSHQWNFSIRVYESATQSWGTPFASSLVGWRGGDEAVVCDGVLYYLIHPDVEQRPHLAMFDLAAAPPPPSSLMQEAIPAPCPLTCARLMNLSEKLVMVGGIGRHDRSGVIRGVAIWELEEKEWREVGRMPRRFFQGFGEFDELFTSCGAGDLVFVQCFGSPALLMFDMRLKVWKWSTRCPFTKRSTLQFFTGFCFEPRLDVTS